MRRLSPRARRKILLLLYRRRRKATNQRYNQILKTTDRSKIRHQRRASSWTVDMVRFEESTEGVQRWPLNRSTRIGRAGRVYSCTRLTAPEDFRLQFNHDEIMSYVYELRRQVFVNDRFRGFGTKRRPSLYVDLDRIARIDVEGALLLAAEIDRVRRVLGMRALMDDEKWHPEVRSILYGLGLYTVIEAGRVRQSVPIADFVGPAEAAGLSIVPFLSCTRADPGKALELRNALNDRCAPPGDASQLAVYDALVEAFNNAIGHAYLDEYPGDGLPRVRRWWAGALIDHREGYLHLVVYDQGVGIPTTLQRRGLLDGLVGRRIERNDADVIAGALQYGRSGVSSDALFGDEADGRGNGLWRMCELAETFDYADVRFTSLKGDVVYAKGGELERTTLTSRFCGTMIRWRATIGARELQV
ncbi:hypothetical protein [Brevundimonas sp. SL130]|uniref:hypothetical protein n=1 Tax=Brevundimonas sp. SL130 TaxID=2995143 RepID=UPI00226C6F9F|nr:hypothetical protein [Brevundimonas sp. SL130]WAC61357.1 hypothetical protein OU998_07930 [Brevundimonas sp. SL130]